MLEVEPERKRKMSLNLALDFHIAAEKYCDLPAIIYNGLEITYGELANSVRYWTILLSRMGVSRGDNVCMVMPNVPEFTIAYFAILHLGAVVVPCNTLLTSHELAYQISHSDSRYVLAHQNCLLQCVQAAREVEACAGVIVNGSKEDGLKHLPEEYQKDKIYWVDDELSRLQETFPFSTETVTVVARHENVPECHSEPYDDLDQAPWPTGTSPEDMLCPPISSTIPIGARSQEYITGVLLGTPETSSSILTPLGSSAEDETGTAAEVTPLQKFAAQNPHFAESGSVWESIPSPGGNTQTSWSPAPVASNPDDTAVILYTSGTTGFPKGAQLTHFNLYSNAQYIREFMTGYRPGKKTLAILPFYHSFGQTSVQNAALFSGATIVMVPRFEPRRVLQTIAEQKVNVVAAVPTMLIHLARMQQKLNLDMSCLEQFISGGATLSMGPREEVRRQFPATLLLEGYGLSETSPISTATTPAMPPRPGSIGKEIAGTQVRIMRADHSFANPREIGEIVIRGHNVMKGYHKNQLATESAFVDSWFLSGDLGYCDEEGFFYLVDRKKDIIIRAGMNIYPREVEEVLYAYPQAAMAAVVGIPHPVHGEDVIAFLTLKTTETGSNSEFAKQKKPFVHTQDENSVNFELLKPKEKPIQALEAEEEINALHKYCRSRLAAYKCPQRIIILNEMPKGPTGKILKRELIAMLKENFFD